MVVCTAVCAVVCALGLGCAAPTDVEPGRAAITEGWQDTGDPAVVGLMKAGALLCSGTLIAPDAVLTAAHCVDLLAPDTVVFGRLPGAPDDSVAVRATHAHPDFDRATLANDIAIVELAYDVDVTPATIDPGALQESRIGSQVRIVGFGLPSAGGATLLEKREGFSHVASLDRARFELTGDPSQPCNGDSGGPTFLRVGTTEPLVGVHSGGNVTCSGGSEETRVDAHMAFLAPYLESAYAAPPNPDALTSGCRVAPGSRPAWGRDGALLLAALFAVRRRRARARRR